jgi:hypothetical protein
MSELRGYYSVIQYCPDLSRLEAANVGVLLFCPEAKFIAARTSAGNDRVRRFFGSESFDPFYLNSAKRSIENRLRVDRDRFQTIEDLQWFVDSRANEIQLTQPRTMRVEDPEADLDALFRELVGGRARTRRPRVEMPELDRVFRQPSLAGRVEFDKRVAIPIVGRTLVVPYAYRNGIENLVKPQTFASDEKSATSVAMKLAIEGDLLHRHGDGGTERRLVVVPRFDSPVPDLQERVNELLGEYQVRVVDRDKLDEFAEEVVSQAHA